VVAATPPDAARCYGAGGARSVAPEERGDVRVAEAVGRALVALGVDHAFGVIGSGNFAVVNALHAAGARFVHARHESAAVCMADGYARVSGRVGVASCHQGPGLTNALTGFTEAAKARTPLLLLAADTSSGAVRSNFRIDQAAAVRACGGVAERVHGPQTAMADVTRAWNIAAQQHRAVALMLPLDAQAAESTSTAPPRLPEVATPAPPSDVVAHVVEVLADAQRPAIIGGRGAVVAGAGPALRRLGARVGAVLATSANGNGLFAGDDHALGISGGFATPVAAELLASADVVLAFGATLNMWTTRHGMLVADTALVVQVDLDAAALGTHHRADIAIAADAGATADALLAEVERRGLLREGLRDAATTRRIASGAWRHVDHDDASTADTIDPRTLSIALDDLLPPERTIAVDSGHFMGWPAMYLGVPDADGFVFNQAYQSIGLGLGAAIGAAVARPDRLAVATLGDGGALMSLGELETAAGLDEPLLVVVYNDAAYGAEVHHFGPMGHPVDLVRFPTPDLAAYGRAAGGRGIVVRSTDDLEPLREWLDDPRGLCVVDARVTPTVVAEWLEEAFRAH
jgi:thiamine pyrophosphate-dependent acetolactate synthase large subunit-like protein